MVKTIAESLAEMKKAVGISNRKLAELSGVPEGTVNKILSGNTTNPSLESVEAMVRAMGRSMDELFGEPETPEMVQTAVVDHYSMLIDSYKAQIDHYRDQLEAMRLDRKERDQAHKDQLRNHRRGLWGLLLVVLVLVGIIVWLSIDYSHDTWGLFQRSIGG